jgi:hypothetical protein
VLLHGRVGARVFVWLVRWLTKADCRMAMAMMMRLREI